MYERELDALSRLNLGATTTAHAPTAEEKQENSKSISAIKQLNERLKAIGKRKSDTFETHGGTVKAWALEHATVRSMPVYVGEGALYLQLPCGALQAIKLNALSFFAGPEAVSADELSFIARFI